MAGGVKPLGPSLLGERRAEKESPFLTIQNVIEAVAVRPIDELARLPAPLSIHEYRHLRGIPIMNVVRHELEIPFQLAGIGVEGDGAVGVQVVAVPRVAVPIWRWIASAPDDEVLFGVERARRPCRRSAGFPCLARPGVAAGLSWFGNSPEAPAALARGHIVGVKETAYAVLAAADA